MSELEPPVKETMAASWAKLQTKPKLQKRTVTMITEYLHPKQLFNLIHTREYPYSEGIVDRQRQAILGIRDRAMMAAFVASAGRASEVVGGDKYASVPVEGQTRKKLVKGEVVQVPVMKPVKVGKHTGWMAENIKLPKNSEGKIEGYILVENMSIVKRSQTVIAKFGEGVTKRNPFAIPLVKGLFDNPFWDQLVPFGWLILAYLKINPISKGKLFPYERAQAHKIIKHVTGQYPNWFRAQAEHFYGNYLLPDSVKLAAFVGVVRAEQTKHYIGYAYEAMLKNSGMDFKWIDEEVKKIQERLPK